jgi:hypothetical protein
MRRQDAEHHHAIHGGGLVILEIGMSRGDEAAAWHDHNPPQRADRDIGMVENLRQCRRSRNGGQSD